MTLVRCWILSILIRYCNTGQTYRVPTVHMYACAYIYVRRYQCGGSFFIIIIVVERVSIADRVGNCYYYLISFFGLVNYIVY